MIKVQLVEGLITKDVVAHVGPCCSPNNPLKKMKDQSKCHSRIQPRVGLARGYITQEERVVGAKILVMTVATKKLTIEIPVKPLLLMLSLLVGITACGEDFSSPAGPGKGLARIWSTPVNGGGRSVSSNGIMLGATDYPNASIRLSALDVQSKSKIWISDPYQTYGASKTYVADGAQLYSFIPKGNLIIRDLITGKQLLSLAPETATSFDAPAYAAYPTVSRNHLFISSANTLFVYDISVPNKTVLAWKKELGTSNQTGLWASPEVVYVTNQAQIGPNVFAFDTNTGQEKWSVREEIDPQSLYPQLTGVQLAGEQLIVYATDQTLRSIDPKTGQRRWIGKARNNAKCDDGAEIAQAEVHGDMLFLGPPAGACLYGISLTDGAIKWTVNSREFSGATGTFGGKPLFHNGVVYAANGNLWAVDAQTGQVLGISSDVDAGRQFTNPHLMSGEIVVWGRNVSGFKPVR